MVMKLSPSRPVPVIAVAPTAAPNPATVGQSVAFSARATDPLGRALTYRWNFGDYDSGSIGTGTAPAHTYAAAGTYQATVTVSDGQRRHGHGGLSRDRRRRGAVNPHTTVPIARGRGSDRMVEFREA